MVDEGDWLKISGWAITPPNARASLVFTCDERPCDQVEYPVPRPEMRNLYPYISYASESGFICRVRLTSARDSRRDEFVFRCFDRLTLESPGGTDRPFFYRRLQPDETLPEPSRILLVSGHSSPEVFYLQGHNTLHDFDDALRATVNRGLSEFPRILDWGCGCGRLAIHFRHLAGVELAGVDVDADNVAWCQNNLSFGQFQAIKLHPPMPFPPESFDLLIGLSVLTHLSEQVAFEWLAELERIAKKGAIVLLTFCANSVIATSAQSLPFPQLRTALRNGFLDRPSALFDGRLDEANYYRDILHQDFYIKRHWSKFFEILRIIPGGVNRFQDLAVLRKR